MGNEVDPSNVSKSPFQKKQYVELSFKHIRYGVRKFTFKKPYWEKKEILHGVSGCMAPGTLTAIMGPSGAGKSTLLNVLAGYRISGSSGQVLFNDNVRTTAEVTKFLRMSCYIQQEAHLRSSLTVQESMMVAAELKLGKSVSKKEKNYQVQQILQMLGLDHCVNTLGSCLSGGQKKRLCVAFELLTNPPIIFMDEPTTGLDSKSCTQCIAILQMLAREGRTVVTTIHQPSALILEMFDNVYALAKGYCIYDGPTSQLIPHLASKGLQCPVYHNPADFLIEVAIGEYGPVLDNLIIHTDTPVEEEKEKEEHGRLSLPNFTIQELKEGLIKRKIFKTEKHVVPPPRNGFASDFYHLYMRNLITLQRNMRYRVLTFLAYVLSSTMLGFTFFGVGNNASLARENLAFVFATLIFVVYVSLMTVSVKLPKELNTMKIEYFNQWFSLPPYYLALLCIEIPIQTLSIVCGFPFLYYLADQPTDLFRAFFFFFIALLTSLTAQSFGFMLGSVLPIKIGVFIGPVLSCVLSVFGFTLRMSDTPTIFYFCSLGSYVRSAFHSMSYVLYGFSRAPLRCTDEVYCHFKSPEKVLKEMDMEEVNIYANIVYLFFLIVAAHLGTYTFLYRKLTKR